MSELKKTVYLLCRSFGLVRLASWFNRKKVIILCFHSKSELDEHEFWPGVFISDSQLENLLDYLKRSHFNVISLQEAKRHLAGEVSYDYPLVLTVDDGWKTSLDGLLPRFEAYQFPSTTYITTYYCDHQIPVINVLLQYWLWKSPNTDLVVDFRGKKCAFSGDTSSIVSQIESFIAEFDDVDKLAFLEGIADALGMPKTDIASRRFHNATYTEIANLSQNEMHDFQLHTHTHRLPEKADLIKHQIETNRERLRSKTIENSKLTHFCYPSGIWNENHLPTLKNLGIETATTLDEGLNEVGCDLLKLKRNLVMDNRSLNHLLFSISGLADVSRALFGNSKPRK